MIPKNITREHLLAAIAKIKEEGIPSGQNSTIYDLEHEGRHYPPKLVVRKANVFANGAELWDFGGGPETNNFLISRGFNIINEDNMTDLASALRKVFPNIWRCAETGKWALIQENSLLSFNWLDPNRDYKKQPATEGGGKKSINPWVNELKIGDLIFVLDKYRFYGIAIAQSEYDSKGPFLEFDEAKRPAIQVKFLFKATEYSNNQFSDMRRPATFSRIDSNGFNLDKTIEILRNHVPGAIDALSGYLEKSEGITTENPMRKLTKFPLNQILYGPPGTGKTFNTINKALEIIGETDLNWDDRKAVKERFEDRVKEGKVVFTTFHQSMSYEDFIEGIKPKMDDDIDDDQKKLDYEIKDGIFKRSCAFAAFYCHERYIASKSVTSEYSFDSLYDAFIEWIQEQMDAQKLPVFKTLRGREVEVKNINRNRSIIARAKHSVAISSAPLTKENFEKLYNRFKSVDEIKDLREVQETVQISPRITEFYAVFAGLKEFEQKVFKPDVPMLLESKEVSGFDVEEILKKYNGGVYNDAIKQFSPAVKPVILIIDEINRGNISQIFGELITLIEEDKRLGKNEALEITLPYSKKPFGVPPNLHIIGTMNTADRSVESLDTALRRRFSFEEMPPKPDILTPNLMLWNLLDKYEASDWDEVEYAEKEASVLKLLGAQVMVKGKMKGYWEEYIKNEKKTKPQFLNEWFSGITLQQILQRINLRVEKLLDPDHQIGHSYFMDVSSLEDLQDVFYHKVIPLLQEYFFGDYGKIGLVLGRGFVRKKKWDDKDSDGFADFGDYENAGDFNDREVFEIVKYHHQPAPEYALKVGESTYKMDFEKAIKILLKLPIE